VRRVCPYCAGAGCFACEGSGLKGRTGLYEMVPMSPPLASLARRGAEPASCARRRTATASAHSSTPPATSCAKG